MLHYYLTNNGSSILIADDTYDKGITIPIMADLGAELHTKGYKVGDEIKPEDVSLVAMTKEEARALIEC